MSELFIVCEETSVSSYCGSSEKVYCLKGLFKSKERADEMASRKYCSKGYVHNAVVLKVETDLFD